MYAIGIAYRSLAYIDMVHGTVSASKCKREARQSTNTSKSM
jgi:hypothetical protein